MNQFSEEKFRHNMINFRIDREPVSSQNKNKVKLKFRSEVHKITSQSEFIITSTCWISIDYYCQHIKRLKNPGVYDIDNIVKPTLDALSGQGGLILDDVLLDRVTVNWVDTPHEDHLEIQIEYPDLGYVRKDELVLIKSKSGWCFPTTKKIQEFPGFIDLVSEYFATWNSISNESEYFDKLPTLPIQSFIYFGKVKDKGYNFVSLENN